MLSSVTGDNFKVTIVSPEWDVEPDHSLASLDEVEPLWFNVSFGSSRLEEKFDLFEETRLSELIEFRSCDCSSSTLFFGRETCALEWG